jgi:hypothetical protein
VKLIRSTARPCFLHVLVCFVVKPSLSCFQLLLSTWKWLLLLQHKIVLSLPSCVWRGSRGCHGETWVMCGIMKSVWVFVQFLFGVQLTIYIRPHRMVLTL